MFEGALQDYPVVIGTFRGVPKRDDANPNMFLTKHGKPAVESPWLPPDETLETPKDVFEDVYTGDPHATRRVWKKSYKGHTILVEDGDGKEFIRIIDRAGQIFEMECPVDQEYSKGNAAQRGNRNAIKGDQLPHSVMRNNRASIRIRDLSGQEIVLNAIDNDESIVIKSKSRSTGAQNKITLSSGRGNEGIKIEDSEGDIIQLDPNSDTPILLQDSAGNSISFDKKNRRIHISGAKESYEEVKQKTLLVDGKKESTIKGDEKKKIQGNKATSVVGDSSHSALGTANLAVGGSIKASVGAALTPASPELVTPVVDIVVAQGGVRIANKAAAVADLAKIEFSTLGDLYAYTNGPVAQLSGLKTVIGGTAADQPLVCGTLWAALMNELITAILDITVPTAVGPSGIPINSAQFASVQGKINAVLSTFAYTQVARTIP
jgi:hypothetical protein